MYNYTTEASFTRKHMPKTNYSIETTMNARVQQRKKFVYTALNDYNKASLIYTYLKGEYFGFFTNHFYLQHNKNY